MHPPDATSKTQPKHRLRQEDFFAQLSEVLRQYDHDGDGLLSEEDWGRVSRDLQKNG